MDDHRFDRIEEKLDALQEQMLKLWQNGLSDHNRRISVLEANAKITEQASIGRRATTQQWLTVVGWLVSAGNAAALGLLFYLLEHGAK